MQKNETNHESTVAKLRDQIKVLEDLLLFLAEHRGSVAAALADIASNATELAASPYMPKVHTEDLLRISCDAAAIMAHVQGECQEIDRAMMIRMEKLAPSSAASPYVFPPARNQ